MSTRSLHAPDHVLTRADYCRPARLTRGGEDNAFVTATHLGWTSNHRCNDCSTGRTATPRRRLARVSLCTAAGRPSAGARPDLEQPGNGVVPPAGVCPPAAGCRPVLRAGRG